MKRLLCCLVLFLAMILLLYISDDMTIFSSEKRKNENMFVLPTTIAAREYASTKDAQVIHAHQIGIMNEAMVKEDKNEGTAPDFQKLLIACDQQVVYISLTFHAGYNQASLWAHIFLNGKKKDTVYVNSTSFILRRDNDNNGYYEKIICKGRVVKVSDNTYSLEIPLRYMPDITAKKIWAYSLHSHDRIPDVGVLLMNNGLF